MSKIKKGDKTLISAVLVIAACLLWYFFIGNPKGDEGPYALISVNQRTYHTIDIGAAKDEVITFTDAGVTYTVEIKDHKICMKEIVCPDQICVLTGYTDAQYIPIICLPNKVMINIYNNAGGEVDTVAN